MRRGILQGLTSIATLDMLWSPAQLPPRVLVPHDGKNRSHLTIMKLIITMVCLFVMSALQPAKVSANMVTIGAGRDATLYQGQPNNSDGGGPVMFVGTDGQSASMRGLLQFNIAANIPAGSTITDAQITLFLGDVGGSDGTGLDQTARTVSLYELSGEWGQGSAGSGSTIVGSIRGFPAVPGNVTWNDRHFQLSQPWIKPGGDFSMTVSASAVVGHTVDSAYTWLSTPRLVADVQSMLDAPSSNEGWALLNSNETDAHTYLAFYTRDWSDPTMRPSLQVTYVAPVPLPAAAWLFGSSLIALAGLLRRRRNGD